MKPAVVVWQRANLRIVAVDEVEGSGPDDIAGPVLLAEECFHDALGGECWLELSFGEDGVPAYLLLLEITSRNEVLPAWVRAFVKEQLVEYEADVEEATP